MCFFNSEKYENADKYLAGNRQINYNVKKIYINWSAGSLIVNKSNEEFISINEKFSDKLKDAEKVYTWLDGDILHIQYCKSGQMMNFRSFKKKLEVLIPKKFNLDYISLNAKSAESFFYGIISEHIEVNSGSGLVKINGCLGQKYDINSSSGEIELVTKGDTGDINVLTKSGKINVKTDCVNCLKAETSSGIIDLNVSNTNHLIVSSLSGKVGVRLKTMPYSTRVNTTTGKILLYISDRADFKANINTQNGKVKSEFGCEESKITYVNGLGENELTIDSLIGDIELSKIKIRD